MKVITAWKAVQSVAIVTGDEVLGIDYGEGSAWKALRQWLCVVSLSYGVVPSRHIVFTCLSGHFVPGYRRFAP